MMNLLIPISIFIEDKPQLNAAQKFIINGFRTYLHEILRQLIL